MSVKRKSGRVRRAEGAANAGRQSAKKRTEKKASAQVLLREMLEKLAADGANRDLIYTKLIEEAVNGDKDAREFIGKYLLGGGKLSSEDLHRQPVIRPDRRS